MAPLCYKKKKEKHPRHKLGVVLSNEQHPGSDGKQKAADI